MALDREHGTEREMLEAHLDANREIAVAKLTGLTWEQATRRLGPSATSAAGVVQHLADAERYWFRYMLDGQEVQLLGTDDDPDLEFALADGATIDSVIADYLLACAESRESAARYSLDDQLKRAASRGNRPSLRWVMCHMIEETARHNGHLDIYRELLDGSTGYI